MSGECDICTEHTLECICGTGCPCKQLDFFTHLNLVTKDYEHDASEITKSVKYINIRGREEHEAIIKDSAWCQELGLDQHYEKNVYLKRWGSWLS